MRTLARRVLVAGALLASATGMAAAQDLTWNGSLGYTTGSYIFTEPTRSFSFTNGLGVRFSHVRFSASLPLVYQNTSAVALIHGVPVPTGGPESDAVRQRQPGEDVPMHGKGVRGGGSGARTSGVITLSPGLAVFQTTAVDTVAGPGDYELNVADPMFNVGIELLDGSGWLRSVEIGGSAKAPIASIESGIGTEAWDVGGGVSVAGGNANVLLFADASYWRYGDMPDLVLADGFSYGAGIGVSASDRLSLIASFYGMEAIVPTADAYASLALSAGYSVAPGRRLSLGAGFGLTEAASDFSLFLGWSASLVRDQPRLGAGL